MAVRRVAALGVCLLLLASLPCIGAPPLNQVDEEDLNLPVVRGVVRVSQLVVSSLHVVNGSALRSSGGERVIDPSLVCELGSFLSMTRPSKTTGAQLSPERQTWTVTGFPIWSWGLMRTTRQLAMQVGSFSLWKPAHLHMRMESLRDCRYSPFLDRFLGR
jgi:hypothetical protein